MEDRSSFHFDGLYHIRAGNYSGKVYGVNNDPCSTTYARLSPMEV